MKDWAKKLINKSGRELVREAVARVENQTSVEIVPMIVRSSCTTGHVPWMVFLLSLAVIWLASPYLISLLTYISAFFWPVEISPIAIDLISIGLALIASQILPRFTLVRRIFTPMLDQKTSVDRRALLEFHLARVGSTHKRTGILLFTSLLERRAVILADNAITEKLPKETWNDVIEILLRKTKVGDFAGGMMAAIETLGKNLETDFPPLPERKRANQLDDRIIIKI